MKQRLEVVWIRSGVPIQATSPGSFARAHLFASGSRHGVQFLTSGAGHYRETVSRIVVTASPNLRRSLGESAQLHCQGNALQFPLEHLQRVAHESHPAYRIAGSLGGYTITVSSEEELDQFGGVFGVESQQQFAPQRRQLGDGKLFCHRAHLRPLRAFLIRRTSLQESCSNRYAELSSHLPLRQLL